jgi:hypothetical protein
VLSRSTLCWAIKALRSRDVSKSFFSICPFDHILTHFATSIAMGINGIDVCCMFNNIIARQALPKYLNSDNNPLFRFYRWQANLRILDITEIKSVPYTPQSHPFVERLIGTIRREYLDRVLFWNERDLKQNSINLKTIIMPSVRIVR